VNDKRNDNCNLLGYAEELLRITEKVISDLSKDAVERFHEPEVIHLEGVAVNESETIWIRVARLRDTSPATSDPMFDGWVSGLGPVSELPRLAESRMVVVSLEEASDLFCWKRDSRWRPTSWPIAARMPTL
jgi:hypothetical protein